LLFMCCSVPLGRVSKGSHALTLKPARSGLIANIGCPALGKTS